MNVYNFQNEGVISGSVETTSKSSNNDYTERRTLALPPFSRRAINNRLTQAVDRAVASAGVAYEFGAGSYTAQALADVVAVQTLLRWIDDLGGGKK